MKSIVLYAVQVKRSDYLHCTLGADSWTKMILNCSEPQKRRRFTILFEPYQSIPRAPEYHPGGRYYFISKSTGDDYYSIFFCVIFVT